ncbi:MAG: hypothetical protein ACUVTM_07030 [Candidatus Bathyarchaeia archaeon]
MATPDNVPYPVSSTLRVRLKDRCGEVLGAYRNAAHTFDYTFPAGPIDGVVNLHATVRYLAYGELRFGDEESAWATVPKTPTKP